jgi:hypothetical protein
VEGAFEAPGDGGEAQAVFAARTAEGSEKPPPLRAITNGVGTGARRGEEEKIMDTVFARFVMALAVLALCAQSLTPAASAQPAAAAQNVESVPPFNFDKAAYEKRLRKAFDGRVMGYSTVLIKHGQVVSGVADGMARNAKDGNIGMTTTIPANIGSTIKFTGGVTLLHLFESKSATINPQGRTVEQWLDQPIYNYFPKIWRDGMHASIKQITFRHLLQHRSGFRNLPGDDFGDDGLKRMYDYLPKGVSQSDFDKRKYANANISLITYLIPMIADPSLLGKVNEDAQKNNWKAEGREIHKRIADEWEKYMHGQIYAKITPAIKPSCNPLTEFIKSNVVWAPDYVSATDTANGMTRDSRVSGGYCQAQGGWYIAARDLAAFVANFNATDTLVSRRTRDLMFDDDDSNERLVWSFTIDDPQDVIEKKFNLSVLPYMGGDHGGAHATILMLPNQYYAVGIINSDDLSSGGVTRRLLRAFKTGIGTPEDPACPALLKAIPQTKGEVKALEAEVKAAQADLKDASPPQKPFYAKMVKDAQAKLKAASDKLKAMQDDAEKRVCY